MRGAPWTPEEDEVLRLNYADHGPSWGTWAALLPGRSRAAVSYRARALGLRVSDEALVRLRSEGWAKGGHHGADGRPGPMGRDWTEIDRYIEEVRVRVRSRGPLGGGGGR